MIRFIAHSSIPSSSLKDLDEIQKVIDAASPGPWEATEDGIRCAYPSKRHPNWRDWIGLQNNQTPIVGQRELNAEFIAQSRTFSEQLVKALVMAVEALEFYDWSESSHECTKALKEIQAILCEDGK